MHPSSPSKIKIDSHPTRDIGKGDFANEIAAVKRRPRPKQSYDIKYQKNTTGSSCEEYSSGEGPKRQRDEVSIMYLLR
jgi:hypothetical protein